MNNKIISYVGWFLILTVFIFYCYGIYEAVNVSWPTKTSDVNLDFNPVLATSIGSIQALLLTNLGMLLGISVVQPNSSIARSLKLNKSANVLGLAPPPPANLKEKIQLWALFIYVLSLIVCSIAWARNDFSTDSRDVVSMVAESGKMFLGICLAYITALLR